MRVLILGIDGYIGWALAQKLAKEGHEVTGVDNFYTRRRVREVGSGSLIPIATMKNRVSKFLEFSGKEIIFYRGNIVDPKVMYSVFRESDPEAVYHLAEQRSAPYSMIGLKQANETLRTNLISTMNLIYASKDLNPDVHIIKIGTMGEYGTPNIDIPEGFFEIEFHGRKDTLPFPRNAGSWYHWSKVHDSNNLMFANRLWGLKITDIMQGVVYGTRTKEISESGLNTRFDIDEIWGTALNRFVAQAVSGIPLTVYGKGNQKRGFLSLTDSVNCLSLVLNHPPKDGEYRVVNQFEDYYSIINLASTVKDVYEESYGGEVKVEHVNNPRVEAEDHYYNPERAKLREMGYRPSGNMREVLREMIDDISEYKQRLLSLRDVIMPRTRWKESSGNSL